MGTFVEYTSKLRDAFSSPRAFLEAIALPQSERDHQSESHWSNEDLDPTPPEQRTWTWLHYASFWAAYGLSTGTWTTAASMITLGLEWWQAWLAIVVSHAIGIFIIVLNGRAAANYHVGYPIVVRMVWGMWGSYWAVICRAILAIIWQGINTYYGGNFVTVAIRCIIPGWKNVKNNLPESAGITTQGIAGFFIFWGTGFPLLFIHARKLNKLFVLKGAGMTVACFGVLIWAMRANGGVRDFSNKTRTLKGTELAWAWLHAFNSGMGATSTLMINQPDLARYARRPSDQVWSQLIIYPIVSAVPALFGILVAYATRAMWGVEYWNLWDVFGAILDHYPNDAGAKCGVFLASCAFAFALTGTNIATNTLPFGADIGNLFPRYINIVRGQILCGLLAVVIVPWKIVNNGQKLITFLSGYSFILAPVTGMMLADYYWVRRGNYSIGEAYNGRPDGLYWYHKGWNWRAVVTWVISLVIPFPGFAGTIGATVTKPATEMFQLGFIISFTMSILLYVGLSGLFPPTADPEADGLGFEALVSKEAGVIEGVVIQPGYGQKEEERTVKLGAEKEVITEV